MRCLISCLFVVLSLQCLPAKAQIIFQGLASLPAAQQTELNRAKTNIENMLAFTAPVRIKVALDASLSCSGGSAVLAQAGPTNIYNNANGLVKNTWYPASLAVQLSSAVKNAQGSAASINAVFNPLNQSGCSLSWHYGSGNAGSYQVSFYDTAIHEIMHGLGFISFWNANAQWFSAGGTTYNDIFSKHLGDGGSQTASAWVTELTSVAGQTAMTSNNVFWHGKKGQQFASLLSGSSAKPKIFAPRPYQGGSSISHFDTEMRYRSGEDEMMEPYASNRVLSHLSAAIFCDIGWGLKTDYDGDGIDDCEDSSPVQVDDGGSSCDPLPSNCDDTPPECDPDTQQCDDDANPCESDGENCLPLDPALDEDGDGIANGVDNCPRDFNAKQLDQDDDGIGDVCSDIVTTNVQWGEYKKQQFGSVLAYAGDLDGDGYGDYWAASPKQSVATATGVIKSAGVVQLVSGKTNQVHDDILLYGPTANAQFGSAVVSNIDYDGDGCIDTFISAPNQTVDVLQNGKSKKLKAAGAVYRFSPFIVESGECVWRPKSQWVLERVFIGSQPNSKAGAALLAAPTNRAEQSQLLIGEPGRSNMLGHKKAGALHLLTDIDGEAQTLLFEGFSAGQLAGSQLAFGRFDGSGVPLVAVSAPGAKTGTQRGGIFWVGLDGILSTLKLQPTYLPAQYRQCPLSGPMASLVTQTDVDVLAVGTPNCKLNFGKQGAVWLIAANGILYYSFDQAKLGFGNSLIAIDFDGDQESELLVGAQQPYARGGKARLPANAGSIFIWDALEESSMLFVNGSQKAQQMGCAFTSGDIDDDHKQDLVLAHCGAAAYRQPKLGATEVVLGRALNF